MLDTIRSAVSEFALGESGRVEQQKALPFAWTAGLMVGAAAVVTAPGVAEADQICIDVQFPMDPCTPSGCSDVCYNWDKTCYSRCVEEKTKCDCY